MQQEIWITLRFKGEAPAEPDASDIAERFREHVAGLLEKHPFDPAVFDPHQGSEVLEVEEEADIYDSNGVLYGCCSDGKEPDWSLYAGLEIGGCIMVDDGATGYVSGGFEASDAEFFTIYGRQRPGEDGVALVDAITNSDTLEKARGVAMLLAKRSGLPVAEVGL